MNYIERTLHGIAIHAGTHQIDLALKGDGLVQVRLYSQPERIELSSTLTQKLKLSVGNHKFRGEEKAYLMVNNVTALAIPVAVQGELGKRLKQLCLAEGCAGMVIEELQTIGDGLSAAEQEAVIVLVTAIMTNRETPTTAPGQQPSPLMERIETVTERVNSSRSMQMLLDDARLREACAFL